MSDHIETLSRAEVEDADSKGLLLGRNKDGGKIIDYIRDCGGYFGKTQRAAVSQMLYECEPPQSQPNRQARLEDRGETYGSGRWERLRRGTASFHPKEAQFIHGGLRRTHGDEWASAFPADELVTLSFQEFLARAVTLGLPWPDDVVPPSVALEVLYKSKDKSKLEIRIADPNASRLGSSVAPSNQALKPLQRLPVHAADDEYLIQIKGADPDDCQLLIFEMSREGLSFDGGNEEFFGFPVRTIVPEAVNITVKPEADAAFKFLPIKGEFAFFALAVPKDWDLATTFEIDPSAERWNREDTDKMVRKLRRELHDKSDQIALAWYGYQVE